KAKPMFEEEARQRMLAGKPVDPPTKKQEGSQGEAAAQIAALMRVSPTSVYKAQKVLRDGSPELQRAVETGKVSVAAGASLTGLDKEQQAHALKQDKATIRAKAKEGARRRKAASEAANNGTVRRSRTAGDGVQNAVAEAGAVKKQKVVEERF